MTNEQLAAIRVELDRQASLLEILCRKDITVSDQDVSDLDDAVSTIIVTLAKYDTRGEAGDGAKSLGGMSDFAKQAAKVKSATMRYLGEGDQIVLVDDFGDIVARANDESGIRRLARMGGYTIKEAA